MVVFFLKQIQISIIMKNIKASSMHTLEPFGKIYNNQSIAHLTDFSNSIKEDLLNHKVLVFKSTQTSISELIRFLKAIHTNNEFCKVKESRTSSELFEFCNKNNRKIPSENEYFCRYGVDRWRVDDSWKESVTDIGCMQMVKSSISGGESRFVDLERVYEELTNEDISFISRLTSPGWNSDIDTPPMWRGPEFEHKSIRLHPETGRLSIFYNGQNTVAKDNDKWVEYKLGLLELFEKRENRFDIKLEENDVAIWDNRCVAHSLTGGFSVGERVYNKIELGKSVPFDRAENEKH